MLTPVTEMVSVTGANSFAPLSNAPSSGASVVLFVNGRGFFAVGSPPSFSVSGNAIAWSDPTYSVAPGDRVVAQYYRFV